MLVLSLLLSINRSAERLSASREDAGTQFTQFTTRFTSTKVQTLTRTLVTTFARPGLCLTLTIPLERGETGMQTQLKQEVALTKPL